MFLVYGVIAILSICSIAVIDSKDETRFVSVVFRHGNRAPDIPQYELYPRDPYFNNSFYPAGIGGLTNEGKRREYKLGQVLRQKYIDFLGDVYLYEDVAARSSDLPRTKMSLQLVLAGLYPPAEIQRWSTDINWQPIPTKYVPEKLDKYFFAHLSCPKYLEELDRVETSPEAVKLIEELRPTMKKLSNITGRPIKEVLDMWSMYHGLMGEVSMNLTLPEWTKEFFPNGTLLDAAFLEYRLLNWNNKLQRLNGGVMLKRMIDDMRDVVNGTITRARKISLFSGHELNVAAFLITLGLFKPHVPEYSSAVIIELIRRDDVHYVKVIRYLGTPPVFEDQEIPNCEKLCPLDRFIALTREVTPLDVDMECELDSNVTPRARVLI